VWTTDPAIRDFVGLAENAWDFTDPTAMPGFGPLESTEQIRQMVAHVVEQIGEAAQYAPTPSIESASDSNEVTGSQPDGRPVRVAAQQDAVIGNADKAQSAKVLLQSSKVDTAMQHDVAEGEPAEIKSSRRSHGRALPQ
jgi:hypothetical protein